MVPLAPASYVCLHAYARAPCICVCVHAGTSILASVHQPRASIWRQFDEAVVLGLGRTLYAGPCTGLQPWFERDLGCAYGEAQCWAAPSLVTTEW